MLIFKASPNTDELIWSEIHLGDNKNGDLYFYALAIYVDDSSSRIHCSAYEDHRLLTRYDRDSKAVEILEIDVCGVVPLRWDADGTDIEYSETFLENLEILNNDYKLKYKLNKTYPQSSLLYGVMYLQETGFLLSELP